MNMLHRFILTSGKKSVFNVHTGIPKHNMNLSISAHWRKSSMNLFTHRVRRVENEIYRNFSVKRMFSLTYMLVVVELGISNFVEMPWSVPNRPTNILLIRLIDFCSIHSESHKLFMRPFSFSHFGYSIQLIWETYLVEGKQYMGKLFYIIGEHSLIEVNTEHVLDALEVYLSTRFRTIAKR